MAASDPIAPARQTFLEGDVAYKRSVSESILNKFGSASNYIMERIFIEKSFVMNGYVDANSQWDGAGGIYYVERQSDIDQFYLAVFGSGTSGDTQFNIRVNDASGVFLNNLFSSNTLSIGSGANNEIVVGQRLIQTTPTDILVNTAGHTVSTGTLNFTQLQAGYTLIPFIENDSVGALNLNFNLRLQEL